MDNKKIGIVNLPNSFLSFLTHNNINYTDNRDEIKNNKLLCIVFAKTGAQKMILSSLIKAGCKVLCIKNSDSQITFTTDNSDMVLPIKLSALNLNLNLPNDIEIDENAEIIINDNTDVLNENFDDYDNQQKNDVLSNNRPPNTSIQLKQHNNDSSNENNFSKKNELSEIEKEALDFAKNDKSSNDDDNKGNEKLPKLKYNKTEVVENNNIKPDNNDSADDEQLEFVEQNDISDKTKPDNKSITNKNSTKTNQITDTFKHIYYDPNEVYLNGDEAICVSVMSQKGGVGKSTIALALAQRCGEQGLKTLLIDGNMEQNSIAHYLGITKENYPNIYSYYLKTMSVNQIILPPEYINDNLRNGLIEKIKFHCLFAPTNKQIKSDPNIDEVLYKDALKYGKKHFQIVIIDTQVLGAMSVHKKNNLNKNIKNVNDVLMPLIVSDWAIIISDDTVDSINNIKDRTSAIEGNKKLVIFNNLEVFKKENETVLKSYFTNGERVIAFMPKLKQIKELMNKSKSPLNVWQFRMVVNLALKVITGRSDFIEKNIKHLNKNIQNDSKQKQNIANKIKGLFFG